MEIIDINAINNQLNYLDETKQEIKQALINKGQVVTDAQTFRSYVDNINNLGMLKQFNTYNELEEDTTAKDGDIAIVYNLSEELPDVDVVYDNFWFPKRIKLNGTVDAIGRTISGHRNTSWSKTITARCIEDETYNLKIYMYAEYSSVSPSGFKKITFTITCGSSSVAYLMTENYNVVRNDSDDGTKCLNDAVGKTFRFNSSDLVDDLHNVRNEGNI